jgi:putative transposase
MLDIMVVLACLSQCVQPTTLRHLERVIEAMLSISGRITMKGLSRWSGKGGSYRTLQRLFNTRLNWCQLNWLLIRHHLWDADDVALMSGDHVVVTKSGKTTYGLDRFFSSLYGKAVPGLCFLTLSLLSTKRRASYPVVTEQVDKSGEVSVQVPPNKQVAGQRGRPKGSKNRNRREVELSPSLCFIQEQNKRLLAQIGDAFQIVYFVFDGELGHHEALKW